MTRAKLSFPVFSFRRVETPFDKSPGYKNYLAIVEVSDVPDCGQVLDSEVIVDVESGNIHIDGVGDLCGQRLDLNSAASGEQDPALSRSDRRADEVERNLGLDLFAQVDAHKVDVANHRLEGMLVDRTDQGRDRGAPIDLEVDDDVRTRRGVQRLQKVMVIHGDMLRLSALAINDRRHLPG